MAINQNKKGGRVERAACKLIESLDPSYEARRSQQYSGVRTDETSADILTNIEEIRFEIKGGYNKTDLYNKQCQDWIKTAKEETPEGQTWAILRKKDYQDWTIIAEIEGIIVESHEIHKVILYLQDYVRG